MAGLPIMLAVEALFDMSLLNCRPSVVAAALLYAERRQRGAVPFWPSMLAKLTGYDDLTTPELACAVRTAQKLCRKVLYTQIYKQQCINLAAQAVQVAVQQQQQQCGLLVMPSSSAMVRTYSGGSSGGSNGGALSSSVTGGMALGSRQLQPVGTLQQLGASPAGSRCPAVTCSVASPHLPQQMSGTLGGTLSGTLSAPLGSMGMPPGSVTGQPQQQVDFNLLAAQYQQRQQQQGQGITVAAVPVMQPSLAMSFSNGLQRDLSGVLSAAGPSNAGAPNGLHGQVVSAFAAPAGLAAATAAANGAFGVSRDAAAVPAGLQRDPGLENLALSLSLLGLNQDAASLDAALSR